MKNITPEVGKGCFVVSFSTGMSMLIAASFTNLGMRGLTRQS